MRLDLHCHTKEGSIDGVAPVESYVNKLITYVKSNKNIIVGGEHYAKLQKFYSKFVEECGIIGYWIYNKLGAIYKLPARRIAQRQYLLQKR